MSKALVSPEMLRWARERVALSIDVLAERLGTKPEKLTAWEEGGSQPTFRQAEKIAAVLHVPFGFLFLPEPPEERLPIPDLRRHDDARLEELSADARDLLRDVMLKLDWFRDFLQEHGAEERPFVGRFDIGTPVDTVAADIRTVLGIEPGTGRSGTWEQHLADLFERCEDAGIWIMRTGYVGSNTHRTLSTADFRGFAVADKLAPIVFINGRDAKAAQAFTLAHELAHIWLGASGVSNPALDRHTDGSGNIELVCNAIAAEVLVPRALLLKSWDGSRSLAANAQSLSQVFRVSRVVIARRALDCGKIGWNQYRAYFEQERRSWQVPDEPGGGDFYRNAPIKNGRRFTRAVLNSAMSGQLLFQDAGNLLHMKPGTVRRFYDRTLSER